MKNTSEQKSITLKTLTKNTVWDVQEDELLHMFQAASKDAEVLENIRQYVNLTKSAFIVEELDSTITGIKAKYEKLGYKIVQINFSEEEYLLIALKKRPIVRVSDLTYENIRHISAAKLIEVLENNFGGGWDSLSQGVKDIIESGFDISTTTLPKDRLHKKGGMYEKKVADGYDVLEIEKGTWVEAIFAKIKPEAEKLRMNLMQKDDEEIPEDTYNSADGEEDDELQEPTSFDDDDDMTEDNYRTTFAISDENEEEAEGIGDFDADE